MSKQLLGKDFDIHTGGEDNIFPHHECEIAQNECSYGGKINYWLHGKHLLVEGKKMSKSKGNFYTIRDLLKKGWKGNEIRLALMKAHYRSSLNFSDKLLEESRKNIKDIEKARQIFSIHSKKQNKTNHHVIKNNLEDFLQKYQTALFDDLNIPAALAVVFDIIRLGNTSPEIQTQIYKFLNTDFDQIFDIFTDEPVGQNISDELKKEIEQKIKERNQARANKNWEEADKIRDKLFKKGIKLIDGDIENQWKPIN
jgi:cysteinyl-tRNA synthetase